MNNSDRKALEFDLVLTRVCEHATFELAKKAILEEEVDFNPLVIKRKLALSKEAEQIILKHGRVDLSDIKDIRPLLDTLNKGLSLTSRELLSVLDHNAHIKRIARFFHDIEDLEYLEDFLQDLFYDETIMQRISQCIDQNAKILDSASSRLKELRRALNKCEKDLSDTAQEFMRRNANSLQESVVYLRHDRYCFLVKNSDKNKFDGFFHGESSSGLATYVEPKVLIILNNLKSELEEKIHDEESAILLELSQLVLSQADHFYNNLDSLIELEKALAKADYGLKNEGVLAKLQEDLDLEEIAHPLIDPKKVVRNSYHLQKPIKGIVISGSNTGGKTVSLKIIGLSVLLTYLGIPLLAKRASVPLYSKVLVDIDEEQSIIDSLSTFSARLNKLKEILKDLSKDSLLLIDEIASGTDPKEGEALALAIIDYLEKKDCHFIITTHFSRVKEHALASCVLMIASQAFDLEKMRPTYKYLENTIGYSNALDIAQNYLNNDEIIAKARLYYLENADEATRSLKALEEKESELVQKEKELADLKAELLRSKETYEEQVAELAKNKEELLKKAQSEYISYVNKQKARLGNLIKKAEDNRESLLTIQKQLQKEEAEPLKEEHDFKVGEKARILSTKQVGTIIAIKKDTARLDVNGINLTTSLSDLEYVAHVETAKVRKVHSERSFKRVKRDLNLIGLHVDEALELVANFLDEAYGHNMKQVKIIHGVGTLALKKAVEQYLKNAKIVKSFKTAEHYDGGSGATIVELK